MSHGGTVEGVSDQLTSDCSVNRNFNFGEHMISDLAVIQSDIIKFCDGHFCVAV
jgi:hypothetical protein